MASDIDNLIKILSSPETQSMGALTDACKKAASTLKTMSAVYNKCDELVRLFSSDKVSKSKAVLDTVTTDTSKLSKASTDIQAGQSGLPLLHGLGLYIIGTRPPQSGIFNKANALEVLRETCDREMSLVEGKKLIDNLALGDQSIFFRNIDSAEEGNEIVQDLARVGIVSEIRRNT